MLESQQTLCLLCHEAICRDKFLYSDLEVQGGWLHGRVGHPVPAAGPHPVLQGLRHASERCQGDRLILNECH